MNKLYCSRIYLEDLKTTIKNVRGISKLQGSSILVTGATGMIGSYIVDTLVEYNNSIDNKISVLAAGRNIIDLEKRFDGAINSNLIFVEHDNLKKIQQVFCPDYVIHAASNSSPVSFRKDPVGIMVGAVVGTNNLLEYVRAYTTFKRFLYVSSGEVYSNIDTMNVRSCYPVSKKLCETLCIAYSKQYGIDTIVVRPCHTFGPNMHISDNKATAQFFRRIKEGQDIILTSEGSQVRSYNYVSDTVSGLLTVLINGKRDEAYDLCGKNNIISIADLANKIAKYGQKNVVYEMPDDTAILETSPITTQIMNSEKLEALGWKNQFSIDEGINHTILSLL